MPVCMLACSLPVCPGWRGSQHGAHAQLGPAVPPRRPLSCEPALPRRSPRVCVQGAAGCAGHSGGSGIPSRQLPAHLSLGCAAGGWRAGGERWLGWVARLLCREVRVAHLLQDDSIEEKKLATCLPLLCRHQECQCACDHLGSRAAAACSRRRAWHGALPLRPPLLPRPRALALQLYRTPLPLAGAAGPGLERLPVRHGSGSGLGGERPHRRRRQQPVCRWAEGAGGRSGSVGRLVPPGCCTAGGRVEAGWEQAGA